MTLSDPGTYFEQSSQGSATFFPLKHTYMLSIYAYGIGTLLLHFSGKLFALVHWLLVQWPVGGKWVAEQQLSVSDG